MTNITEMASWDERIHQIQRAEAVLGGRDGAVNIQASQLANRTQYLKQSLQAIPDYREFTFYTTTSDPDGTRAGLAATQPGQTFRVGQGVNADIGFKYYSNVAGTAFAIASFAGKTAYDRQIQQEDADWRLQMQSQQRVADTQRKQEDADWRIQHESQRLAAAAALQQQALAYYSMVQASGYQVAGIYAAGLEIKDYNRVVVVAGVVYKPLPTTPMPYVLTGTPSTDLPKFYAIGDGQLKTQMAQNTGLSLLGHFTGGNAAQALTYVTPELFGAGKTGDDTGAIQNAIDFAIANKISTVVGCNSYNISNTLLIAGAGVQGVNVRLMQLKVMDTFISPKDKDGKVEDIGLWNAPPTVRIGDNASNMANINLHIDYIDGNNRADGVANFGFGYSLSHIHIGYAVNCIKVVASGKHLWPNASIRFTGFYWVNNWIGMVVENSTSGTSPIVEGWKIEICFMAANRYGGIWMKKSGHYAQIRGDLDFNGRWLSVGRLSAETNLGTMDNIKGLRITNGTTQSEFLFRYTHQGRIYVVLAEGRNVSIGESTGSSYKAGDVLTCTTMPDVKLVIDGVSVCADNPSGTNFFDILHDFDGQPFSAMTIDCGYLSVIIGSMLHTNDIRFHNSFNRISSSTNGLAVGNSGEVMSLHNLAHSDAPFFNLSSKWVNFDRKFYMKERKYTGSEVLATVASSDSKYLDALAVHDLGTDKTVDEGSKYRVEIVTNYQGCGASFDIWLKGEGNVIVTKRTMLNRAFKFRWVEMIGADGVTPVGATLQLRQQAQPSINFLINIVRVN
ncbi:hypothetical protein BS639_08990 [Rouxiella silvae]|uniref:Tail fiber protein n=1 Tax=Rouxiella silvae TaxID=1646373 RepID=A0ABX3U288_9GAMM|nr:hypothetical protein [Rouxiella silvae]ORJ21591.1 hypothetical protein BS639_08990 [Rouxiella silvae]